MIARGSVSKDHQGEERVRTFVARALHAAEGSQMDDVLEWMARDEHATPFSAELLKATIPEIVIQYGRRGMLDGLLAVLVHSGGPGLRREIEDVWRDVDILTYASIRSELASSSEGERDEWLARGLSRISPQAAQRWLRTMRITKRLIERGIFPATQGPLTVH